MKKMKMILMSVALCGAMAVQAQTIINTAGNSGAFRVLITDPFGTQSFSNGSASFTSGIFGWQNSGGNAAFSQMIQFDVTGAETALNSGNTVTLTLNDVTSYGASTSASVYFAALSNVDVQDQGDGGGNGLLASAALMGAGTLVQSGITSTGQLQYDVTTIVQSLDYSSNKHLYFRFEMDAPTTSPGAATNTGSTSFNASTLTIAVPEPSSYALLAGMLALASIMLRRRR
jgi:hypothetical protein